MTDEQCLALLQRQIEAARTVRDRPRFSPEFSKWRRDTAVAIERIFGHGTRHASDFGALQYTRQINSFTTKEILEAAFLEDLEHAAAIMSSMMDEIREHGRGEELPGAGFERVERLFRRFHLVARGLRGRHDSRTTLDVRDEYDVQDLLHALLTIDFDDIRREEWTPSYAGKSSRMDFLLKREQLVIEVKKTRDGLGAKEVGDQLIIDIERYAEHRDCSRLLCFVYDPEGLIGNPRGLESDLSGPRAKIDVRVTIAP